MIEPGKRVDLLRGGSKDERAFAHAKTRNPRSTGATPGS
jgi:hypothetical protein